MKKVKKELLALSRFCASMNMIPNLHALTILFLLHDKPGLTQADIMEELDIGPSTFMNALKSMKQNGKKTLYVVKLDQYYYVESYAKAYLDQAFC